LNLHSRPRVIFSADDLNFPESSTHLFLEPALVLPYKKSRCLATALAANLTMMAHAAVPPGDAIARARAKTGPSVAAESTAPLALKSVADRPANAQTRRRAAETKPPADCRPDRVA